MYLFVVMVDLNIQEQRRTKKLITIYIVILTRAASIGNTVRERRQYRHLPSCIRVRVPAASNTVPGTFL